MLFEHFFNGSPLLALYRILCLDWCYFVFSNILVGGIGPTLSSVKYNFYPVVALVKLLYGDFEEPPV
jgi:hypothetical protein